MYNFTILKEEKLNNILENKKVAISDFAIVLGGFVYDDYYISDSNKSLKTRTGDYWTSTPTCYGTTNIVYSTIDRCSRPIRFRDVGARPALYYQSLSDIPYTNKRKLSNNEMEFEFGFYPQTAPDKTTQNRLLTALNEGSLTETGNIYTIDSRKYDEYGKKFKYHALKEYEFEGKRYVCVTVNSCFGEKKFQLSNEEYYKDGDQVFIEVEPVKWKVFEKEKIILAEKILFAGIQFDLENNYKGKFNKTNMKKFMNVYFRKDLLQSSNLVTVKEQENDDNDKASITTDNYIFNVDSIKTPLMEEILKPLSKQEVTIVNLAFGEKNGNYYSIETIAEVLNMKPSEVRDILLKVLTLYKEQLTDSINQVISTLENSSEEPSSNHPKTLKREKKEEIN